MNRQELEICVIDALWESSFSFLIDCYSRILVFTNKGGIKDLYDGDIWEKCRQAQKPVVDMSADTVISEITKYVIEQQKWDPFEAGKISCAPGLYLKVN